LLEPINGPFLKHTQHGTHYAPTPGDSDFALYAQFAERAFAGQPLIAYPRKMKSMRDFWPTIRPRRQLLIKEVNPLATNFLLQRFAPRPIILLRHPAAVAESHARLGLIEDYEGFGQTYGDILARAIADAQGLNPVVAQYEYFAREPETAFTALFEQLQIRKPDRFEQLIADYCRNAGSRYYPTQVKRLSGNEVDKWKRLLPADEIAAVMRGYARSALPYYLDESI
jgi:hypothetical protein